MKKDLLSIICLTLVCATVMLGVMSIYRFISPLGESHSLGRASFAFETANPVKDRFI